MQKIAGLLCLLCCYVTSTHGIGSGGEEQTTPVDCIRSSAVRNLSTSSVNSSSVTISWTVPDSLCGTLIRYEVRYRQSTSVDRTWSQTLNTVSQQATINGLESNTEYTFKFRAISQKPPGRELNGDYTTITATTDPGAVAAPEVLQQNTRSLKYRWTAPRNSAQFDVCVYGVFRESASCSVTSGTEETRQGLSPNTDYTVEVSAVRVDQGVIVARGAKKSLRTKTICERSSAVRNLSRLSVTSSSITIRWDVPEPLCGTLTRYEVKVWQSAQGYHSWSYAPYTVLKQAKIDGLESNTEYTVSVRALSQELSGRELNGEEATVRATTAPAKCKHLEAMRVTNDSFEARWTAPHEDEDGQLQYSASLYIPSTTSGSQLTWQQSQSTSLTTVLFDKLIPETAYRLYVTASSQSAAGTRLYGDFTSIDIRTDCSSPPMPFVTIESTLSTEIHAAWIHSTHRCLNLSYVIFAISSNWTSQFATSSREFVIRNLQPYTNYTVIVSAVRTDGLNMSASRNSSSVVASTTAAAPLGMIVRPATQVSSTSAVVMWSHPTSWNGHPGGYIITLITDNETLRVPCRKHFNDTEHSFVHLQPSTNYVVHVMAYNTLVNSSVEIVSFTTLQLPALSSFTLNILISTVVSTILIVVLAIFIGLWIKRRRSSKENASAHELSPLKQSKTDDVEKISLNVTRRAKLKPKVLLLEELPCDTPQDVVYGNSAAVGIALSAFPAFVRTEFSAVEPFSDEFKGLKSAIASLQTVGQKPSNKGKNRFKDILPYDHTRVILTPQLGDADTDYINASFIEGYGGKPRRYIAAQGPTNDTMADFWRMVLDFRSEVIVMVTGIFEAGTTKCACYWPESGTKVYGDTEVTLLSSDSFPDYKINALQVVRKTDGFRLIVKHFYYTGWPDHGVPNYALSLLKYRRNIVAFTGSSESPTVVHCSAGVGRTGTYIAIDYLLNEAQDSGRVNVRLCVERLREQRPKMVQTREQYAFIYQAVLEATQAGITAIGCEQFCSHYKRLTEKDNELLRKEYATFASAIQPLSRESCSVALLPENAKKNVNTDIVPANNRRPILLSHSTSVGATDYINAVFLSSHEKKDGFIVTQTPLPHTKDDFWRMVLDHRVGTIIALDSFPTKPLKSSARYWPEMGENVVYGGAVNVECVKDDSGSSSAMRTRDFKVSTPQASDGVAVRQFEFLNWPTSDLCPKDETSLLELIKSVDSWATHTEAGTILVHCSNGANRSGLLVAAMNALRCAEAEQVVDIYTTGLLLRQHRPQFLSKEDQYFYLYKLMASFVETFETYSNFLPIRQ